MASRVLADQFGTSWEELVNFDRLRRYRTGMMTKAMKEAGLGGVIAFRAENVRYISSLRPLIWEAGYQTRNMVVATAGGKVTLFVASGDYQRTKANCPWLDEVIPLASMEDAGVAQNVIQNRLVPQLKSMGLTGTKVGMDTTTFYTTEYIRDALAGIGSTLTDGEAVMRKARSIKSKDEVSLIQIAAAMVDSGIYEARKHAVAGATENEVAGSALESMYALGTEWMPVNPAVFSGVGPYRRYSTDRRLKRGENVVVDLSAMHDGYCAQGSRTFTLSQRPGRSAKLVERAKDVHMEMVKGLRPGTLLEDVARSGKALAKDLGDSATRFAVRGAGLTFVDLPQCSEGSREGSPLAEGMVATLELRVHERKLGTIQIADTIHVSGGGPVPLTRFQDG
jgi:Xaa-Pro aminopeptidase